MANREKIIWMGSLVKFLVREKGFKFIEKVPHRDSPNYIGYKFKYSKELMDAIEEYKALKNKTN